MWSLERNTDSFSIANRCTETSYSITTTSKPQKRTNASTRWVTSLFYVIGSQYKSSFYIKTAMIMNCDSIFCMLPVEQVCSLYSSITTPLTWLCSLAVEGWVPLLMIKVSNTLNLSPQLSCYTHKDFPVSLIRRNLRLYITAYQSVCYTASSTFNGVNNNHRKGNNNNTHARPHNRKKHSHTHTHTHTHTRTHRQTKDIV